MTGLDKIVDRIRAENDAACAALIESARHSAEKAAAKAREDAEASADAVMSAAGQKARQIQDMAMSSGEMKCRQALLAEKGRLLDEAVALAVKKLADLPDGEYFGLLERLAVKNAMPGDGVILLGKKDLERLPDGFADRINARLTDGRVSVSAEPADIENGFILSYGEIEQNCEFSAVARDREDDMKAAAFAVLFGDKE
ncbi:MAG: hypothetical protein IIZ66_06710 [Clostridia bacterium]|nr:hypothetical protein [Clostridia bacterium]